MLGDHTGTLRQIEYLYLFTSEADGTTVVEKVWMTRPS
jgi:hypothetical protein